MAEKATKTPLDDSKDRLREAKDERRIAKDHLSKAKQDLVEVRREYPEKIATAKNTLWHARETLREERKKRKHLAGRRRTLHRQRHRNEAARAKLDARIEKKQHAVAKMEARIREDKERLERLPRESRVRLMLCRLLKVKIDYLEWRSAWTRQTTKRLEEGTGQLDGSRSRIEDKLKDVENLLKDKEREEGAAEDVEKKRKELDTLTDARKKEKEQAENRIRTARENVREKRRAVWGAASRVNRKVSQFLRKRVADKTVKIVKFGRWAGFAGVAGCFYAYAVSLGAIYRYFYFRSNGINIFSYAEPIDFLAPGYSLAALFMLMTGLVFLIPLVLYYLVKLIVILPLPLSAEILAAVLPRFAKWVPKTSLFVLCCTVWLLCSLLVAAGVGHRKDASPTSQDCVSIVTDPPFQDWQKHVRIGSTSKYLFLREGADGCPVSSTDKVPASNRDDEDLVETIKMWLETAWAELKNIKTWPGTAGSWLLSIWAGDEGNPHPILVVPLSKITRISEIGGNGEALSKSTAAVVNGATGEHIHPGYVTEDRIQRINERTSRFEGRIVAVEQQVSGWSDTVGKGIEDIRQAVGKITNPGRTKTSFEKDVMKTLESIADKLGQSNDGSRKDNDSGTQSPETCGGVPCATETLVHQYIADDMDCPPGKLHKSRFFSFVHRKGDVVDKSREQEPDSEEDWKQEIQEFVQRRNDKAKKWIVYGLASWDGGSDHNNALSRQRAETVKGMMCDASKTSSETKPCPEKVEIRSLGENHSVTGTESRSAVIAVCEQGSEQNPEKATMPAGEPVSSSG